MAIQNDGAETPNREKVVSTLSRAEYCRTAEMIPAVIPIRIPKIVLETASVRVYGYLERISWMTGLPVR